MAITDIKPDAIFIGSCTNSRIEDLRAAAAVLKGRRIAATIRKALVVPGSGLVKPRRNPKADRFSRCRDGVARSGCSMCLAMNADRLLPGERCASTSNLILRAARAPAVEPILSARRWLRRSSGGTFVAVDDAMFGSLSDAAIYPA